MIALARILLVVAVLAAPASFGSYEVYLEHAAMKGACAPDRFPDFRNRAYRFRTAGPFFTQGMPVTLRSGVYSQRAGELVDWEVSLEEERPIHVGSDPARILLFFANHLGGSGSATQLLIVRCRHGRLETVFEVGDEGMGYSYSESNQLHVTHAVWLPDDPHAGPSRQIDELYEWDSAADRFRLTKRSETRLKP
jgi:hypothetical protein